MIDPTLGTWDWVSLGTAVGVMGTALVSDIRHHTIPNTLTYPAALVGLGLGVLVGGPSGGVDHLLGGLLGFGILFLAYMFGGIGGGDVKLSGALGCLVGLSTTALGLLYMGLLAGAMALGLMIWNGRLLSSLRNMGRFLFTALVPGLQTEELKEENSVPFPLGVAIVGGFAWALVERLLGAAPLLDLGL